MTTASISTIDSTEGYVFDGPQTAPSDNTASKPLPTLHDIVVIGAGACGLAVAARLCEHTPSAIFTDEEHQRYHWIRKHGRKMSIIKGKGGCVVLARSARGDRGVDDASCPADGSSAAGTDPHRDTKALGGGHGFKTLVLDATADKWMANWNRLFKLFDITHLRSPMFFHVDPRDRDGLLAYTYERERKGELREIRDCVGKEVSKHRKKKQAERMSKEKGQGPKAKLEIDERDRKDYYVPSRALFNDHCECVVNRYGLNEGLIRKEAVLDIDFGIVSSVSDTEEIFTVTTNKEVHYARAVVAAVGAGNAPAIPGEVQPGGSGKGACHSNQIREFPPLNVVEKIKSQKDSNVLIVGGGLTSAQLGDFAIRQGVKKVWHLMRGDLKVKHFDVSLEWVGKFKNHEKAIFWSADSDQDRLQQIRTARNGGSITPTYHKILKSHIATGRISLHTHTTLSSRVYDPKTQAWTVTTDPALQDLPHMDYIYFATGIASDFATLPFLQTMLRKYPLHGHGGFPCLSEDLMWRGTADGVRSTVRSDELSKVDGRAAEDGRKSRSSDATERDTKRRDSSPGGEEGGGNADVSKRVPLFVTGRFASLRLGPGAGNLEGARVGAERIVWALQEVLADVPEGTFAESSSQKRGAGGADQDFRRRYERDDRMYRYCAGIGSRFESLGVSV